MARTSRLRPNELVSPWPHGETSDPAGRVAASFVHALCIGVQSEPDVLVVVNGEESFSHQRELESLGGAKVLGMTVQPRNELDRPSGNGVGGLAINPNHDDVPAELKQISAVEHQVQLTVALSSAQQRILIVSPWIRGSVVNPQFVADLERRLKRNVEVCIGYGTGPSDTGSDSGPVSRLKDLARKYPNMTIERLSGEQQQILLYDDKYIASDFNWLAFRTDSDRAYRIDDGTLISSAAHADRVHRIYQSLIDAARDENRRK